MTSKFSDVVRANSHPLEPIPTDVELRLQPISGIAAVVFDVYGTMLISGSGDVGTVAESPRADALRAAFAELKIPFSGDAGDAVNIVDAAIVTDHLNRRDEGIEFPEVDIVAVWDEVLEELAARNWIPDQAIDSPTMAIEFEVRANPVWPMPFLEQCLAELVRRELTLGIISNAQFFTPELFPGLIGKSLQDLGFRDDLMFFSYRHGYAKPGVQLYENAARALADQGIAPQQVLYIGNDMLNDVWPARQVGFKTVLYGGDARSLRLREGDERVRGLHPDLVINTLQQLTECLELPD